MSLIKICFLKGKPLLEKFFFENFALGRSRIAKKENFLIAKKSSCKATYT
jgi:hypothetical protein